MCKVKKRGFTLIELIVVVAILLIVVGIIIGFQASVIQNQSAKKTAYQTVGFLKSQITKSFSERKSYSIIINYTNGTITLSNVGSTVAIDQLKLSSSFNYTRTDGTTTTWSGTVSDSGKFSVPNFGIIIKKKNGVALYKITSYSSYVIKGSDINLYRATGSGSFSNTPLVTIQ